MRSWLFFFMGILVARWVGAAGPTDVVVGAYRTEAGAYLLWRDGRITDAVSGAEANGASDYTVVSRSRPRPGRSLGSGSQAVQALSGPYGTQVLFADGSLRQPRDAAAAAPSEVQRVESGSFDGVAGTSQGLTGGVTVIPEGREGHYVLQFHPPFRTPPTLLVNHDAARMEIRERTPERVVLTFSNPTTTTKGWDQQAVNTRFLFLATGH